jgi:hypothetical protein
MKVSRPVADLFTERLGRRHAGVRQVRRATENASDRGVIRQRPCRIQPSEPLGFPAHGRQLLASHQAAARDVAVGIALPHADKDLAVLEQFES